MEGEEEREGRVACKGTAYIYKCLHDTKPV